MNNKKDLKVSFINGDDYQKFLKIFDKESSRGKAIIGHAFLDVMLSKLLMSRLVNGERDGKIGSLTFENKAKLSYSTGVISEVIYKDLLRINKIRNIFAHHIEFSDFDKKDISKICASFEIIKILSKSTRSKLDLEQRTPETQYTGILAI